MGVVINLKLTISLHTDVCGKTAHMAQWAYMFREFDCWCLSGNEDRRRIPPEGNIGVH